MFFKICFILPILIASFINSVPISSTNKALDKALWNVKDGKLISSWTEENIYLYAMDWKRAEEHDGVYREIVLSVRDHEKYFSCWQIDTNPVRKPTFNLSDINNDGKKELIVISTSGYGTGILLQDVHVFRFDKEGFFYDIYVMDPREGIYQNIKGKLTKKDGIVTVTINIKGNDHTMTAKESSLAYWGNEVGFGSVQEYKVIDNKLIAEMNIVVGNDVSIAVIVMEYVFENGRLRVNNVTLKKHDSNWQKWNN
ncbi:PliI family lysozyme inhibitor of I-type lysozyme [Clostridium sp. MSJ-11]|uniref:PliI family lysozyme inhibitor of I-type lysozyme n=1 Tax=Clostridium mobile TaxID=2841512 RepID=A0ABS6EEC1_9CLOT|nr:PliI family lysozyme inhibitor of I-type lysozyme [Clostridium mobile]MBU5483365.1 PliI family lysozyme inhibitor of I-type lysozyme [Clostridium mobile]